MTSVPPYATLVRADNPGPMTLEGTNSWVLRGDAGVVVVDPGPALPGHLDQLTSYGRVLLVLLTHGHADHAASASELSDRVDAPVAALDPLLCRRSESFHDRDRLDVPGLPPLTVLATPGHTGDSVCFEVDGALVTGDTLLGRGSTMVGHPDGRLDDYFATLRLIALRATADTVLLPGHGPAGGNVLEAVDRALAHRVERLEQVRRAVNAGATTADSVVEQVYAGVEPGLLPAALATVRAQLAYLVAEGGGRG
ncbi:MBL fold metallo-hydrolase [Acidothermaceae bacterium B102]|nr:MBL fold metallo-hydrolase [Acidothermaceae bacterium B102]